MNNKGFTLIELLAVIVLLALITSITVVTVTSMYTNSKDKTEEIFKNKLTDIIEDYITLKHNEFDFNCAETDTSKICTATKYKNGNLIYLKDIVTAGLISEKDIINPKNKDISCNINSVTITIYRNNSHVYRFETDNIDCLTAPNQKITTKYGG